MKNTALLGRLLVAVGLTTSGATAASAQKLPLPNQKNPDWTLLKTELLHHNPEVAPDQPIPVPMPNIDARGGMKDSSGQWTIYYDSHRNVRYNMADLKKNRLRVQDLRTGTVYTYVPKKGASRKLLN